MDVRELTDETCRRAAVPILQQLWTDADEDDVLEWTGAEGYHLLGGFVEDELVAVAGVLEAGFLHHVRHAWLYDLVVDERRRGEGYGRALVEFVEEWASEREYEYVSLASPLANDGVHEFYEGQGYEKWGYVVEKEL